VGCGCAALLSAAASCSCVAGGTVLEFLIVRAFALLQTQDAAVDGGQVCQALGGLGFGGVGNALHHCTHHITIVVATREI